MIRAIQDLSLLESGNDFLSFCISISEREQFREDYEVLYKIGVLCDLYHISSKAVRPNIKESLDKYIIESLDVKIINRLLQSSFIFANLNSDHYVDQLKHDKKERKIEYVDKIRNQAYRIAISLYYYGKYLKEEIKLGRKDLDESLFSNNLVIYRIFTRLGILSASRNDNLEDVDIFSLDLQGKIESINKEVENLFCIGERFNKTNLKEKFGNDFSSFKKDEVLFSDFQVSVMDSLLGFTTLSGKQSGKSVAISAPTSAGKTFVLKKYILYKIIEKLIRGETINVVFIVPSKALINELKSDFLTLFEDYLLKGVSGRNDFCHIHTYIGSEDFKANFYDKSNLFLFTQERLNFFYSSLDQKEFKLDLIVIDEAHKVGYGYRGTLLSYIVGKIQKQNKSIQIVLLAPLLSKLHKFQKEFNLERLEEKFSNFGLVAKNEIIVSIKKKKDFYEMMYSLKVEAKELILFKIEYELEDYLIGKSFSPKAKLSVIPRFFTTGDTQSIIFKFGSDTVINQIELLKEGLNSKGKKSSKLTHYLKDILPNKFGLSELIESGVSYHNGKLPISIKSAIEEEFKKKRLKYLCANYTVLEGVNLPAKNIFISREEYNNSLLTSLDVKNLIGRSGRLNEHLSGNVFFVNFNSIAHKSPLLGESTTEDFEVNFVNVLNTDIEEGMTESKFDRFLKYIEPGNNEYNSIIDSSSLSPDSFKSLISERKDFEYMLGYLVSKVIDDSLGENPTQFQVTGETLEDIISRRFNGYQERKSTNDIFSKIGYLIYENKNLKEEKISKLRRFVLDICNNDLNIKSNGDEDFLRIVQKNIFVDPRKQLDFYDSILAGKNIFINDNIVTYVNALKLLTDRTKVGKKEISENRIIDIEKRSECLKNILEEVQKYFIQEYLLGDGSKIFHGEKPNWNNTYIYQVLKKWISSISLIKILQDKPEFFSNYLSTINEDIQFNYLNAFSIYFEIANLAFRRYLEIDYPERYSQYLEEGDFPNFDINFVYYMELGTFYPNLVYLISKGVSRESAIWLVGEKNSRKEILRNGVIDYYPFEGQDSSDYFIQNKEKILSYLEKNNKVIIKEELMRFIY